MAKVSFVMGQRSNLPAAHVAGRVLCCTDERSWYIDISDSERIRIGDFQEVTNIAALASIQNPATTALYYATAENVLCKYNGTNFVQINRDTGATSIEVVGEGNAVTAASYDAGTRKLTLTKGETFAVPADITAAVGDLGEKEPDVPYANMKDYVDTKIADVVAGSIEGLGDLASKDKVAEADLEATLAAKINGKADLGTAEDTSATNTLMGVKKYAEEKATAAQTAAEATAAAAIEGLDKADAAVATQLVSAVSQENGVIAVTRRALVADDIPEIPQSKVTDLTTTLAGKQDNITFNTAYDAGTNKAATMADVQNAVADLSGAMHYEGNSTTDPATDGPTVEGHEGEWAKGDVVSYNAKEFVYNGTTWRELGDEASFAVKGSIKDADIAADAAIAQSKIAGLEAALAAKATPADITGAIEALDVADEAVEGQFVSAVVETDGKIAVTRRAIAVADIPTLSQDKVSGLTDSLAAKASAADLAELEELVGETAVSAQISAAVGALDNTDAAVEHQFVTAVKETDGVVTVERAALVADDIPALEMAKVNGLSAALSGKQDTVVFNGTYNAESNKAATMSDVGDAESNAKSYADGLAANYDEAGAADTAEANAKSYVDGLLEWGTF